VTFDVQDGLLEDRGSHSKTIKLY